MIFFSIAVKLLALIITCIWKMTNIKSKTILYSCCVSQNFFLESLHVLFKFSCLLLMRYYAFL